MNIITKTKLHFLESFRQCKNPPYEYLPRHVFEAEKWAEKILRNYPEADREAVLLSVWLHDIGQVLGSHQDHAVNSEIEVRNFLPQLKISPDKIGVIAKSVRAHKCKDVLPESLEARVLAVSNAVSHMTDFYYITMANRVSKEAAINKFKRDCGTINYFPEIKKKTEPFCKAWKELLKNYPI